MITWEIPIMTVSEANSSQHWSKKAKRHKQQQFFIRAAYEKYVKELKLPCNVTMTRLAPRSLDDDNLTTAFKYIRDEISECIFPEKRGRYLDKKGNYRKIKGRADSDPRITWQYAQQKNPVYAVRIDISF